jgi:SAM-dependent methyltransferase
MTDASIDWHRRYSQQASWTEDLRNYLFERAGLHNARRVLDVGCGTGVLEIELTNRYSARFFGLDIDNGRLMQASHHAPSACFSLANACQLPFPDAWFDITFCHFLLLWVAQPMQVLAEMKRVTQPGGFVLALAEPDYGGRIDYPSDLEIIGQMQLVSLRRQGTDPLAGRKLAGIFHQVGLQAIETGLMGGQWKSAPSKDDFAMEWSVIQSDLGESISSDNLERLRAIDAIAWQQGERVLFVPTFYALGKV